MTFFFPDFSLIIQYLGPRGIIFALEQYQTWRYFRCQCSYWKIVKFLEDAFFDEEVKELVNWWNE